MHRCGTDRRIKCEHADKHEDCDLPSSEGWITNCKLDKMDFKRYVKQTNKQKE